MIIFIFIMIMNTCIMNITVMSNISLHTKPQSWDNFHRVMIRSILIMIITICMAVMIRSIMIICMRVTWYCTESRSMSGRGAESGTRSCVNAKLKWTFEKMRMVQWGVRTWERWRRIGQKYGFLPSNHPLPHCKKTDFMLLLRPPHPSPFEKFAGGHLSVVAKKPETSQMRANRVLPSSRGTWRNQ